MTLNKYFNAWLEGADAASAELNKQNPGRGKERESKDEERFEYLNLMQEAAVHVIEAYQILKDNDFQENLLNDLEDLFTSIMTEYTETFIQLIFNED